MKNIKFYCYVGAFNRANWRRELKQFCHEEGLDLYMQKFGMELTDKQVELFKRMPSAESITRARRNIQEQGKYIASNTVDKYRFDRYMNFKHEREYANL